MPAVMYAQQVVIEEKVKFLALGDSYTIGESVSDYDRWPNQLIDRLRNAGIECDDATIVAHTGWRTPQLQMEVNNARLSNDYNLVSILIGVNDLYNGWPASQYTVDFEVMLDTAISLAGGNRGAVFVLSIPDYGFTPFGQGNQQMISKVVDEFNAINKAIAESRQVKYFDITEISRRGLADATLIAGDGLHPSGKMYSLWVSKVLMGLSYLGKPIITGSLADNHLSGCYPNPFTKFISVIRSSAKPVAEVALMGTSGIQTIAYAVEGNKIIIDAEAISSGLYVLSITDMTGQSEYYRVVKY
jgi:lysophospholipase L1-like esterase